MYSLNLNDRFVLITADEVVKKCNVTSIDPHQFISAIEVAEERFVRPLLGYEFYEALVAEKNVIVDDDNKADLQGHITLKDANGDIYQLQNGDIVNAFELCTSDNITLWKERLWKFTAECVYLVALVENYAQFTTQGVIKNNPKPTIIGDTSAGESAGVDLKDIKYLNDKQLLERIEPLKRATVDYLCRNGSKYPLWDSSGCNGNSKDTQRFNSWVTGIYDKQQQYPTPGHCSCPPSNDWQQW